VTQQQAVAPISRPQTQGAAERFCKTRRGARRPSELLQAVAQLDATIDPRAQQELIDWVQEFYAENQGGDLVGMFGECFLGHPFVDHRMLLTGQIVEHFRPEDRLPEQLAPCRALVRSKAYLFIEIYADGQIVPIRTDGTPAI